jgi:hypothetical protein
MFVTAGATDDAGGAVNANATPDGRLARLIAQFEIITRIE